MGVDVNTSARAFHLTHRAVFTKSQPATKVAKASLFFKCLRFHVGYSSHEKFDERNTLFYLMCVQAEVAEPVLPTQCQMAISPIIDEFLPGSPATQLIEAYQQALADRRQSLVGDVSQARRSSEMVRFPSV